MSNWTEAQHHAGWSSKAVEVRQVEECDFCGLRVADGKIGTDNACTVCLSSRVARIRACHQRLTRHRTTEDEQIASDVVDVFEQAEEL